MMLSIVCPVWHYIVALQPAVCTASLITCSLLHTVVSYSVTYTEVQCVAQHLQLALV
jgi:hypothetical protein